MALRNDFRMRVLFIGDRNVGGIQSHLQCLMKALPGEVVSYAIGENEAFAGRNGHDVREWWQIRRVIHDFHPDVVHFQIPNLLMALYVRWYNLWARRKLAVVCSWHTPTNHPPCLGQRVFFWLLGPACYYLPVSTPTWNGLRKWLPKAWGKVFFNPVRLADFPQSDNRTIQQSNNYCVGMVGRAAAQKDWPSFHKVEGLVQAKMPNVRFLNAGEEAVCDGRAAIASMDLFVMTSRHEELPTTVLECFALGTPICGFLPEGGTSDILSFSSGAVRSAFLQGERDCARLAELVMDLLQHPEKRMALAADGRRILAENFDAERNCRERLVPLYRSLLK